MMKRIEIRRNARRALGTGALLGLLMLGWVEPVAAGLSAATKCKAAVAKAAAAYAGTASKELAKCEQNVIKGKTAPGSCPDAKANEKITAAAAKVTDAASRSCGGLSGADLELPGTCPGVTGECDGIALADADDLAECAICSVDAVVVGLSSELLHGDLVHGDDAEVDACQAAISAEGSKLVEAWIKEFAKCTDSTFKGKFSGSCPDPKTATKLAGAVAKLNAKICATCGGADEDCGGFSIPEGATEEEPNDLTAARIGLPGACPAITTPAGTQCDVQLSNLQAIADCVACTAEFSAECAVQNGAAALGVSSNCNPPVPEACAGPYTILVTSQVTGSAAGVTTRVQYPGAKIQLSGSPINETGVSDGLFSHGNVDAAPLSGFEDQLSIGLVSIASSIPSGDFATVAMQCRPGSAGAPVDAEISCVAEASDLLGNNLAATCTAHLVPVS